MKKPEPFELVTLLAVRHNLNRLLPIPAADLVLNAWYHGAPVTGLLLLPQENIINNLRYYIPLHPAIIIRDYKIKPEQVEAIDTPLNWYEVLKAVDYWRVDSRVQLTLNPDDLVDMWSNRVLVTARNLIPSHRPELLL